MCWLVLFIVLQCPVLYSQDLYIVGNGPGGDLIVGQYDINTCTFCPEMEISASLFFGPNGDVVPLPNGQIVISGQDVIYVFDPPNPVPILTLNSPNFLYAGVVLAPNGNVYLSGADLGGGPIVSSLYEYNPVTNTLTLLGSFPPNTITMDEIFYWNGVLYAFIIDLSNFPETYSLASIQIGNPLSATIIYNYPSLCGSPTASISNGPNAGIYTGALDPNCGGSELFSFDLPSNTTAFECDILPSGFAYGMGEIPAGFPPPGCNCTTNAGTLPQAGPFNICTNSTLTFPPATGTVLDANDLLRYILFSNPADTAGSIVAISSTPTFTFNSATMQTGVTYYIAAMAGNGVNGNVGLNDPCLDFSNALQMIWRPLPSVTFSVANPNVCAGACTTVTATFTGIAPFTLTYTTPASGTVTQTFSGNTGTVQVCTPVGSPPGSWVVQATELVDLNCTCN